MGSRLPTYSQTNQNNSVATSVRPLLDSLRQGVPVVVRSGAGEVMRESHSGCSFGVGQLHFGVGQLHKASPMMVSARLICLKTLACSSFPAPTRASARTSPRPPHDPRPCGRSRPSAECAGSLGFREFGTERGGEWKTGSPLRRVNNKKWTAIGPVIHR